MTKMKNTKKGMAKKALSISLVAAMLATSNVPVWAAFEADDATPIVVEAPVAEAPVEENAPVVDEDAPIVEEEGITAFTTNNGDIDASIELKVGTDVVKSVEWGTSVSVNGQIIDKTTGGNLTTWNYGWREKGTTESLVPITSTNSVNSMGITPTEAMAGKTLELYIYAIDSANDYAIQPMAIAELTVDSKKLTSNNISIVYKSDSNGVDLSDLEYNGFIQNAADKVSSVTCNGALLYGTDTNGNPVSKVNITSSSAKNAGDEYNITISSNCNGYSGSVSFTKEMDKADYNTGDIEVSLKSGLEYQYTGKEIKLNTSDVTAKESTSTENGADGKFGGADLSSAVKKVVSKDNSNGITTVGTHQATVTLDYTKLLNFDLNSDITVDTATDNTFKVIPRNLSTTNVVIGTNGEAVLNTSVSNLTIAFYDGSTKLDLTRGSDYTVVVKNAKGETVTRLAEEGSYSAEITHYGSNTINSKTVSFRVEGNVVTGATSTETAYTSVSYTGSEIKPSKADIGTVTIQGSAGNKVLDSNEWDIIGYGNNKNVSVDANGTIQTSAYVEIKVKAGTYKDKTAKLYFKINPLIVQSGYITVPKSVVYDSSVKTAKEYQLPITVVAKDSNERGTVTLAASDYTVEYKFVDTNNATATNAVDNYVQAVVTVTNNNFKDVDSSNKVVTTTKTASNKTKITNPALAAGCIKVNPTSYTYTGGIISPEFVVMDGDLELEKDVDYTVVISNALNVGTGTITVQGAGNYSGTATADFTITPASLDDVKVTVDDMEYTGKKVRPDKSVMKITLNGNDVSDQFEISAYGTNIEAGQDAGTVTLKLVKDNKNFSGTTKTVTFNIVTKKVAGILTAYDSFGAPLASTNGIVNNAFKYDGKEKTFASVKLTGLPSGVSADDFEIKYVDNVYGKVVNNQNIGWVYAVAKEGVNYSGDDTITTADGTVIKGVVAKLGFYIDALQFTASNVTVKNGVYASGLPVKPEVLVQFGGNTLVEGTDYTVKLVDANGNKIAPTEVTVGKPYGLEITGKGGYASVYLSYIALSDSKWGIDKFNFKNADVTVVKDAYGSLDVTVKNGVIEVAASDYEVKDNENGTVTISAKENSKNYVGAKTVAIENEKALKAPAITASVDRNMVDVALTEAIDGATTYDYVLCQSAADLEEETYFKSKMSVDGTSTQFQFVREGQYYVYARAAKRDENGKKVVSDWSVAAVINVTCDTPNAPTVTKVTTKGNTVTVTYTTGARTEGVDVIIGGAVRKQLEDDAMRPVNYNSKTGLIKNVPATTKTVTFTNVAKGTYFVGVHPYITSNDGLKYFGRWSKQTGITKVVVG